MRGWFGIFPSLATGMMKIMFAGSWIKNPQNKGAYNYWRRELKSNSKKISKSFDAVLNRKGVEDELRNITCPTLIIVGDEDLATKPEKAKFIQMSIPNSNLHILSGSGHNSSIEKSEIVIKLIDDWMDQLQEKH